jgi:hypothetical protein
VKAITFEYSGFLQNTTSTINKQQHARYTKWVHMFENRKTNKNIYPLMSEVTLTTVQ